MRRCVAVAGSDLDRERFVRHKTWFRLVLKAIGVLLIGFGIPEVLRNTIGIMDLLAKNGGWTFITPYGSSTAFGPGTPSPYWLLFWQALPDLAQIALGLYLLLGGKWLLNKIIPSNRPYCHECGYDLSKNQSANCPECGVELPSSADAISAGSDS